VEAPLLIFLASSSTGKLKILTRAQIISTGAIKPLMINGEFKLEAIRTEQLNEF
jgi:hypothetical protein